MIYWVIYLVFFFYIDALSFKKFIFWFFIFLNYIKMVFLSIMLHWNTNINNYKWSQNASFLFLLLFSPSLPRIIITITTINHFAPNHHSLLTHATKPGTNHTVQKLQEWVYYKRNQHKNQMAIISKKTLANIITIHKCLLVQQILNK